jgi:hypothetical protein
MMPKLMRTARMAAAEVVDVGPGGVATVVEDDSSRK